MNEVKHPVFGLTREAERIYDERCRQERGKMRGKSVADLRSDVFGQLPAQGNVKPEGIHHMRIAPGQEVRLLGFGQSARAAAVHFSRAERRAKAVEIAHRAGGQIRERRAGFCRDERKKPAKLREIKHRDGDRRAGCT